MVHVDRRKLLGCLGSVMIPIASGCIHSGGGNSTLRQDSQTDLRDFEGRQSYGGADSVRRRFSPEDFVGWVDENQTRVEISNDSELREVNVRNWFDELCLVEAETAVKSNLKSLLEEESLLSVTSAARYLDIPEPESPEQQETLDQTPGIVFVKYIHEFNAEGVRTAEPEIAYHEVLEQTPRHVDVEIIIEGEIQEDCRVPVIVTEDDVTT